MAIPADTVWEVEPTGNDNNGGGFSIAQKGATGVDMTYGAGQATTTFTANLSAVGTTTLTCSAALFTNTMLGNVINIAGQGAYCIQGFTSSTVVTVDRNLGTFTLATGVVGGALASPGQAASAITAGNDVWIQSGTYTIASTTANIATGKVSLSVGGTSLANSMRWEGYGTTRGDKGTKPILQVAASGVTSITVWATTANYITLENITIDGNLKTTIQGCSNGSSYVRIINCLVKNCTNVGINWSNSGSIYLCEISGCTGFAAVKVGQGAVWGCYIHDNGEIAIQTQGDSFNISKCLITNNNALANEGQIYVANRNGSITSCKIHAGNRNGIYIASSPSYVTIFNCLITSATVKAIESSGSDDNSLVYNCALLTNTISTNLTRVSGTVTLSSDPYVNSAGGNYDLTPAAIALIGQQALPGAIPGLATTVNYEAIGAVQPQRLGGSVAYVG